MVQFARSLACLAFVVAAAGCSSHRYTVLEPASQPLADYTALEVRDFTSNLTDEDSKDLAGRFADSLFKEIQEERKENPRRFFDEVTRGEASSGKVLMLDGTVISFEKGSRAKRYFIGYGAGKAYCTIQAVFTDKATGEQVLKANFDGELSMSFFGGSAEEAVEGVVKAFIEYFEQYFPRA